MVAALLVALSALPASADGTGSRASAGPGRTGVEVDRGLSGPGVLAATGERPARVLPRQLRGRAALTALGDRIAVTAARNGLSAQRLTEVLTEDSSAWLDEDGRMFYRDELPTEAAEAAQAAGDGGGTTTIPAYPTSQTFALHSLPGANRTIYLDFDGATVSGTAWNQGSNPIAGGTHIGYDSDGDPTTFTTAEHAWMQEVWRQVAETYAALGVDVTTADPGPAALHRSSSSDTTYGTTVLVTNSSAAAEQACSSACLGVAYVGTFDSITTQPGYYQPAWVFSRRTLGATVAAQGASHEAGHNLGLGHDGTASSSYYQGTKAWGPIMGSAMNRAVSQFSIGEYAGANNQQDDFATMQSNGLAARPDDHGSSVAAAVQLGEASSYTRSGVISTRTDTDVFAVDLSCTTDLAVTARGIGAQAALDLQLEVLDADEVVVGTSAPASGYVSGTPPVSTGMDAALTVPDATGTYYLRVDGVGHGNPATTGWSDYGSLGRYTLTASGCAGAPPNEESPPETTPPASEPPPATAPPASKPAATVARPSGPRIARASSGARGRQVTAVARWRAPASTGGAPITRYRVLAKRLDARGRTVGTYASPYLRASVRKVSLRLPRARYRFQVVAWNRVGASTASGRSNVVRAR